jgi:hypothetical protein
VRVFYYILVYEKDYFYCNDVIGFGGKCSNHGKGLCKLSVGQRTGSK